MTPPGQTGRRIVAGLLIAGALGSCGSLTTSPPQSASGILNSRPAATAQPSTAQSPVAHGCIVDLTITGDFQGRVTGPQNGKAQRTGPVGEGTSIDVYFDLPAAAPTALFQFGLFDLDGPTGPGPLNATLGRTDTGAVGGWQAGYDPGTATLAPDGSSASFDLTFPAIAFKQPVRVVGSVSCPDAAPSATRHLLAAET